MSNWSIKYWEKRRELEDLARLKMENDTTRLLQDIFPEALKNIQAKLLSQADLHDMTQAELLADYSKRDQEKYRKYIDQNYQELMSSDAKYQEFIDEYFPPYDYAKVNRLLQMRTDIFNELASAMIKKDATGKFNNRLEDIVNRTYNSNANALGYLLGGDVSPLPKAELDAIMNYPWSGKTFSNRLWGNVSKLEQNLSKAVTNAIASGEGLAESLKTTRGNSEIADMFKLESSKFDNAIENLVRTEYSHFAVEGIKASFKATGVPAGQVFTAEDERVCSICGKKHKQVVEEGDEPPYHGRCRCTLMPKMPELDNEAIDAEYEALFGDMLDEFASNKWGVKLNRLKNADSGKTGYNKSEDSAKNYQKVARLLENDDAIRQRAKAEIQLKRQYDEMYNQYTKIRKSGKFDETLRVQIQVKYKELAELQKNNAHLNAAAVKEILGQYRSMGLRNLDISSHFTKPKSKYAKFMRDVYDHYPTDWIKNSIEYGQLDVGKAKRGYYLHSKVGPSELRLSNSSGQRNQFRTALHEMAHRQEHINKLLLDAEKDFYEMRTKGEDLKRLKDIFPGIGYRASEVTRVDNFNSPYMGKDYGGRAYELMSMGLDTLYTRPLDLMNDKEMFEWVIEMLLTK
ncbi:phage head morphogenesis protein [Enterococcus sp. SMC-9]|uniref:phage head morphogenesis protein n=1 Tax=Enterococcus sp. SMC-9 TaxID=2862343 RepID=UPI001E6153B3|nr:phage head morphogenesis protein [Enterococcus sp. SMC-9]